MDPKEKARQVEAIKQRNEQLKAYAAAHGLEAVLPAALELDHTASLGKCKAYVRELAQAAGIKPVQSAPKETPSK